MTKGSAQPDGGSRLLSRGSAAIAAAILLGFAVDAGGFATLDRQLGSLLALQQASSPAWLIASAQAVSWVGGGAIRWITVIALVVLLWRYLSARSALALAAAALVTNAATSAMKAGFGRARPDIIPHLDHVGDLSYPSGHVSSAAVVYVFVALIVAPASRFPAIVIAMVLIGLTAISRMMLGVHWFTDTLGGALLGAGIAMTAAWWLDRQTPGVPA